MFKCDYGECQNEVAKQGRICADCEQLEREAEEEEWRIEQEYGM
jgi:hypothetical protein